MRWGPTFVIVSLSLGAPLRAEHGRVGETGFDDGKPAPKFDGASLVLPGDGVDRNVDGALPPVPAAKPVSSKGRIELPNRGPVVFLAVGVDDLEGLHDDGTVERAKALRRALAVGDAGARVVEVHPLTVTALADAWRKVRMRERFVETPTGALVVVDTTLSDPSSTAGVEARLGTAMGPVRWSELARALRRLDASVYPETLVDRPRTETVFLGSFVGQVDCDLLPGPFFGATANRGEMEPRAVAQWVSARKKQREFPLTAMAWFRSWEEVSNSRSNRGFHCVHDAAGTVEGIKAVVRPWLQAPTRTVASEARPRSKPLLPP